MINIEIKYTKRYYIQHFLYENLPLISAGPGDGPATCPRWRRTKIFTIWHIVHIIPISSIQSNSIILFETELIKRNNKTYKSRFRNFTSFRFYILNLSQSRQVAGPSPGPALFRIFSVFIIFWNWSSIYWHHSYIVQKKSLWVVTKYLKSSD